MPLVVQWNHTLDDGKKDRLFRLLRAKDDKDLKDKLQRIVEAAWAEYMNMLLGTGLPTTAAQVREDRLLFLIRTLFEDRIPTEAEVAPLFKLRPGPSRSLIEAVLAKYEEALATQTRETLRQALDPKRLRYDDGAFLVSIESRITKDRLNAILEKRSASAAPIASVRDTSALYLIPKLSYELLCGELDVVPLKHDNRPAAR
jgi:hypothetical protein